MSTSWTSGWREVFRAEEDEGFRAYVEDLTQRGLRAIGLIGPAALLVYLSLHLLRGRAFDIWWDGDKDLVIWDKLIILVATALLVPLARTTVGRRFGRWIVIGVALVAGLASVVDDIEGGDASFSSAWVALFVVVAAFAVPLRPRQVVALSVGALLAFAGPLLSFELAVRSYVVNQVAFLASILFCVTGFSMMLYRVRLSGYRATEEVRLLSSELADKADHLERLERMKSRFFTGITHDIRTPLSLVLGPINDVLDQSADALGESLRRPLAIARRNAHRLRELTDDLLDLARIEAGHLYLHDSPHDVAELVGRCVLDLQPLAERNGVTMRFEAPDEAATANVDPDRMAQVVQNIVGNALTHTPAGGTVSVSVAPVDPETVRIRVEDTGPGIPPDQLEHLFDRFHRPPGSDRGPGYGLGLAIARELSELHGGRVAVSSRSGVGSTFDVLLPRVGDPPVALPTLPASISVPERESLPEPQASDSLPHVLVADDNPDMRDYLRLHLEGRYRLSEAGRGDDALSIVRESTPDLVISDVLMPGMNGFELCRAIRADPDTKTLPVVLITARGDADARIRGLEAGADDFLLKPFDSEALVARLENLIELRRLLGGPVALGPTEIAVESADQAFVERVRAVVEDHLADTNFGVDWLADEVGLSSRQLQRRIRDATRLSAAGFIRMLRLGRAAQLLTAGATNVSETAYAVGFRDADHFSKLFRQAHGVPPSEFAQNRDS